MNKEIQRIKKYSIISSIIFVIFTLLGIAFNWLNPEETEFFFSQITEEFSFIENFNFLTTLLFIFLNNTLTLVIGTFLGVLFAAVPILFLAINGFVIGVIASYVYPSFGALNLFISLAPHGVFELTALFISSGMGVYLGVLAIEEIKNKNLTIKKVLRKIRKLEFPNKKIKEAYKLCFSGFVYIVLPLVFLAAVVESLLIFMV
ncbi:MAG: stage II sporulation protein M [Patescibacteria group bacterium]